VRSVTGAEPTTVISSFSKRNTTLRDVPKKAIGSVPKDFFCRDIADGKGRWTYQMRANTQHDQPFWPLNTIVVLLGITEGFDVDLVGLVDLICRSVTDEDGFTVDVRECWQVEEENEEKESERRRKKR
jgi:hypothetical protein